MLNRTQDVILGLLLLCCMGMCVGLTAQEKHLYGYWHGKMKGSQGKYEFNLDIRPGKGNAPELRGVAIHDRNGGKEVIELQGTMYGDYSVYLGDVADRYVQAREGKKYSRLQFVLKFERGGLVLDGHWQEYRDLRRYRKGRLVLRKERRKA